MERESLIPLWVGMRATLREINNKFYQKIQGMIKFLYKDFNRAGTARINAFGHCSNSYVNEKGSPSPRGWGSSLVKVRGKAHREKTKKMSFYSAYLIHDNVVLVTYEPISSLVGNIRTLKNDYHKKRC